MPFIIPIQSYDEPPGAAAVFIGGTQVTASLSVTSGLRGVAAGGTQVTASLSVTLVLEGVAAGGTQVSAALRIGDETNVFLAGVAAGGTEVTGSLSLGQDFTARSAGGTQVTALLSVTPAEEFGFTVFVDVLSAGASDALNNPANIRRFRPRLLVAGVPVPILRAEESAQPDKLGIELTVVLARPDVHAVSIASPVDFEIGVWTGAGYEYIPRLTGARLSGRGARYANEEGLPADAVSLSFVDVLGDRWSRAPERNLVLYDPDQVAEPQPSRLAELAVYEDAGGGRLDPEVRAVSALSLLRTLDAAFVEGCGFDRVVTNVEDFPVEQVSFTRAGGYDAGVRSYLSLYDVTPSVVGNDLWLIDTGAPLPAGLSPRAFPASQSLGIDDTLPRREPVTAILVRLRDDSSGEYWTEEPVTPDPVESGTPGVKGFTRTSKVLTVRKWRNFSAPEVVVREETVSEETTVEDFEGRVVSRETRRDSFDALGRHAGYTREVEQRLPDVEADGALTLQRVAEETQLITYTPDPRDPRRDLQDRVETRKHGLILIDEDRPYLGEDYRLPLRDAHRSGYIDPDAGQRTEFGAISTELIELKVRGQQVTRERRVQNHITGAPDDDGRVEVLPADNSVERQSNSTRTVLVRIDGDGDALEGRRVPEFDGTGLPPELALKLARRRLALLNNPQREVTVQAAYVDPLVRRGADLRLYGREGSLGDFIVRGYSIIFSSEGADGFDAQMSITAKELRQ